MTCERMKVIFGHLGKGASTTCSPSLIETNAVTTYMPHQEKFQYTLDNPHLSQSQRKFYEENGYLVIPKLIEEDLLDECKKRFVGICEGTIPKGNISMMKEKSLMKTGVTGEYLYYKVQDILWDEIFSQYVLHDKLLDYVECFTGPNIMAMHSMLINKPPDSGEMTSTHPLHQDLYFFPFRPAERIVASWTAMERVTLDNGCIVVVPGSHKGPLLTHTNPDWENGINKAFYGIQNYSPDTLLPLEMEKGDTVFFHPVLIHGSGANLTKGFRKAISCHYAASECTYIDVTDEVFAGEIEDIAKQKGFDLDYQLLWKLRGRNVRGKRLTL